MRSVKKRLPLAVLCLLLVLPSIAVAKTYSATGDTTFGSSISGWSQISITDEPYLAGNRVVSEWARSYTFNQQAKLFSVVSWLYYEDTVIETVGSSNTGFVDMSALGGLLQSTISANKHYSYWGLNATKRVRFRVSARHETYDTYSRQGYDICSSEASVYVTLTNTSAQERIAQDSVIIHSNDDAILLIEQSKEIAHSGIARANLIPSNYHHYTAFDTALLLSGEMQPISQDIAKAFFAAVTPIEAVTLREGDCVPAYWFSPDGDKATIGIAKADGSAVVYNLDLNISADGSLQWDIRR